MTDAAMMPARELKRNARARCSPTSVGGSKLALHFGVTRQRVDQLYAYCMNLLRCPPRRWTLRMAARLDG